MTVQPFIIFNFFSIYTIDVTTFWLPVPSGGEWTKFIWQRGNSGSWWHAGCRWYISIQKVRLYNYPIFWYKTTITKKYKSRSYTLPFKTYSPVFLAKKTTSVVWKCGTRFLTSAVTVSLAYILSMVTKWSTSVEREWNSPGDEQQITHLIKRSDNFINKTNCDIKVINDMKLLLQCYN